MVEKITMFKASDGKTFDNRSKALRHELAHLIGDAAANVVCGSTVTADEVVNVIVEWLGAMAVDHAPDVPAVAKDDA